jgi:hypothetical protein
MTMGGLPPALELPAQPSPASLNPVHQTSISIINTLCILAGCSLNPAINSNASHGIYVRFYEHKDSPSDVKLCPSLLPHNSYARARLILQLSSGT